MKTTAGIENIRAGSNAAHRWTGNYRPSSFLRRHSEPSTAPYFAAEQSKSLGKFANAVCRKICFPSRRGEQINCPHIEKACTSATYSDRILGVSETVET